jgi:hypothetical protein
VLAAVLLVPCDIQAFKVTTSLLACTPSNITVVLCMLQVAAEHAAAMTALQEQLQQSQKGAKRLAERGKAAAAAAAAAERQKLELEQQLEQARCVPSYVQVLRAFHVA